MPYSIQTGTTEGDIATARISVEQLKQLTSEDGASVVQAVVDAAIADADALIDSYCGKQYVVPFNPVPTRVKALSADIATFHLFKKRAMLFVGEIPEAYRDMYDDAIAFLKDVATGKAVIDGAIKPTVNTARTGGSFQSDERTFTKDALDKL